MNKEVIILIVIVVIVLIYFGYRYIKGPEKLKNIKKDNLKIERIDNNKKIIQYFGGDYCPFSNFDSNAYKVIKDFENSYGDRVTCKYYWVGEDDEIMKKLNVQYVPTILNGNNDKIELTLSDNIDKTKLSNEELKILLLENIYNKL